MTVQTAYNILGITKNTSEADLIKRHRKLIMINHPDKGGSTYLTLRINEAKDFILKSKNDN
jgi:preprotein translocase subunit Sec63